MERYATSNSVIVNIDVVGRRVVFSRNPNSWMTTTDRDGRRRTATDGDVRRRTATDDDGRRR
ncbi:hypothetical protein LSAT2_014411, partial [Lamellibrachia satsuma]